MHRNDERVWLPELMQLKLSTLEKLVSIFANGQIYCFCTNKVRREGGREGGRAQPKVILTSQLTSFLPCFLPSFLPSFPLSFTFVGPSGDGDEGQQLPRYVSEKGGRERGRERGRAGRKDAWLIVLIRVPSDDSPLLLYLPPSLPPSLLLSRHPLHRQHRGFQGRP
jgi:hypothetical protein